MVGIANMMAGQPQVYTYSITVGTSTTTTTITIPATAAVGDIVVLFDRATNSGLGAPNAVTPAGWTQLTTLAVSSSGGSFRSSILYKVLVAGDPGSTITGMNRLGAGGMTKMTTIFRPLYRSSVLQYIPNVFNTGSINNGTAVTPNQTITDVSVFNNNPGILIAQYTSFNTSLAAAIRGFTSPYTVQPEQNNGTVHYVKYAPAPLGSNFAINTTISLSNAPLASRLILQSGLLVIK